MSGLSRADLKHVSELPIPQVSVGEWSLIDLLSIGDELKFIAL
jgi:hypothetical protein